MKTTEDPSRSTLPPAWQPALVWASLSALASGAMAPYLLALSPGAADPAPPMVVLAVVLGVQTGVMAFLLGWAGTTVGRGLGLGSPLLDAVLRGRRPGLPRSLAWAALGGALGGLGVVVLDGLFAPSMPPPIGGATPRPSPLQGLLASAYGGITEEVLTRLGLMTLLAWATSRISGGRRGLALGVGLVGASLIFGALHLPAAAQIWPLTGVVVARTMLLNVVFGVIAGVLYARRGLEHAMVAHLCADLVLHVIVPALGGG